jgi:hypothetical protein
MDSAPEALPDDVAALKAALIAARGAWKSRRNWRFWRERLQIRTPVFLVGAHDEIAPRLCATYLQAHGVASLSQQRQRSLGRRVSRTENTDA